MPKGTKILMVDDDKMLLDMYKERLELAGYKVEATTNGEECLAKIRQIKPDIVLLDIMMPKVNGYDTLASLKSDPATKDIPVIILSALVRDINKSRSIEAGADDYIIKSEVMPVDVIKKIENVLAKYNKDTSVLTQEPPKEETKDVNNPPSAAGPPPVAPPPPPPQPPPPPPPLSKVAPPEPKIPSFQDIQFEPQPEEKSPKPSPPPSNRKDEQVTKPRVVESAPPTALPATTKSPPPVGGWQTSPLVLFFLILIVTLIIASDIFFYLRAFRQ